MTDDEKKDSFIYVKFDEFGSAFFEIYFNNVSAGQVLAVAAALEVRGKNAFIQEENKKADQQQPQIVVPKPGIVTPGGRS